MRRKSEILSLILIISLVFSCSPFNVLAGEPDVRMNEEISDENQKEIEADTDDDPADDVTDDVSIEADEENSDDQGEADENTPEDISEDISEDTPEDSDTDEYVSDEDEEVCDDADTSAADDEGDTELPLKIQVSLSGNVLKIKCKQIEGTYRYQIRQMTGEKKTFKKKTSANTYSMKISTGQVYKVSVTGKNENGSFLSESYKVCRTAAVKSLKTLGRSRTTVRLYWTASRRADSYRVYQKNLDAKKPVYKYVKQVSGTQATVNVSYSTHYRFKIVPVFTRNGKSYAGKAKTVGYSNMQIVSTDHKKYTYNEMVTDIKKLSKKYAGMVQYKSLGTSYDGRKIYDVIVGNPKAEKCIVIEGAIHAREYMTTILMMAQIEYYMESQTLNLGGTEKVEDILQDVCIHFVPMINPDGVTISQSGISAIRSATLRTKLRKMAKGSTQTWKSNARGVDLNRNWNYIWYKFGKAGFSGYSGSSAESERETKAMAKLKRSLKSQGKLKAVLSYHTIGNVIFRNAEGASNHVQTVTNKMYAVAQRLTGYRDADGVITVENDSAGNSQEWDWYVLGVPSLSIEVGSQLAPGPISEFPAIWNANKKVVIREAQLF